MKDKFLFNALKDVKKSWLVFFEQEFKKDYFTLLDNNVKKAYMNNKINPVYENIFKAFEYFDVNQTVLVILGQDPYHIKNMADGLAFSTKLNIKPKSLSNIFSEIKNDFQIERSNCDLEDIAKQNVLLLNTILTVQQNCALSHKDFGWTIFTKNLLNFLSSQNEDIIYLLMGNWAISFKKNINNNLAILKTSHPSPFSYHLSLKNSNTFKKINFLLQENNKKPLKW